MIVVVAGQKGGPGKTTFAINIAVDRVRKGKDLLLLDTDFPQLSANKWSAVRNKKIIDEDLKVPRVTCMQKFGNQVREEIKAIKSKFEDFVIDTPGHDSEETRGALLVADIAIFPFKPAQLDLWTLGTINKLIGDVKYLNDRLRAFVCFNQASPNISDKDEIDESIEYFKDSDLANLTLAQTIIYQRKAFRGSVGQGLGVIESQPDSKAALEFTSLLRELLHGY